MSEELRVMSKTGPSSLVRACLLDMEEIVFETLGTFRTDLARSEVIGLPTPSLPRCDKTDGLMNTVPQLWRNRLPSDRQNALCATKVVTVPHLLGSAKDSPFHSIVANCDALVFESKLMELCVQYKWEENVWPKRKLIMLFYILSLCLASTAMVAASTNVVANETLNMLQAATTVFALGELMYEVRQLVSVVHRVPITCLCAAQTKCVTR